MKNQTDGRSPQQQRSPNEATGTDGRATHVVGGTIGPEGMRLSPIVRPKQQAEIAQPSVRRSYQKLCGPDGLIK